LAGVAAAGVRELAPGRKREPASGKDGSACWLLGGTFVGLWDGMCEVLSSGHVTTPEDVSRLLTELAYWSGTALIMHRAGAFLEVWMDEQCGLEARLHSEAGYPEDVAMGAEDIEGLLPFRAIVMSDPAD
jgi:hypothetical protein